MDTVMQPRWMGFLLLRLPIALAVLAVTAQAFAALLADVPRLRHPLDARVIEVSSPGPDSAVLLFGDSITQDVAKSFDLGQVDRVRDLTANKASGIPGAYLLLRRYLEANPAPDVLAFAITPEFAGYVPDGATAEIYLESVFEREEEQSFLHEIGVVADDGDWWRPAILSPQAAIFDRIVALASGTQQESGTGLPPVSARPESDGDEVIDPALTESFGGRLSKGLTMNPGAQTAWAALCRLAADQRFDLAVRWAPVPLSVWQGWTAAAAIARMESEIRSAGDGACAVVSFSDFNAVTPFPDVAFRDQDHLRRPDWTGWYAHELALWIETLEVEGDGG